MQNYNVSSKTSFFNCQNNKCYISIVSLRLQYEFNMNHAKNVETFLQLFLTIDFQLYPNSLNRSKNKEERIYESQRELSEPFSSFRFFENGALLKALKRFLCKHLSQVQSCFLNECKRPTRISRRAIVNWKTSLNSGKTLSFGAIFEIIIHILNNETLFNRLHIKNNLSLCFSLSNILSSPETCE